MVNIRFFAYVFILMIVVTCTCARSRNWNDFNPYRKRLFGCADLGSKCKGFFSKSCCDGYKCNSTTGKCVPSGSSSSWLGDRNGK